MPRAMTPSACSTPHTLNGVAVSAQRAGLLPISQHSMFVLKSLGYHDFEGPALNDDEKPRLAKDLGDNSSLILRNHGLLTVGETVADAFIAMYYLEASCAIQVRAQSGGGELIPVPKEVMDEGYAARRRPRQRRWPGRPGVAGAPCGGSTGPTLRTVAERIGLSGLRPG